MRKKGIRLEGSSQTVSAMVIELKLTKSVYSPVLININRLPPSPFPSLLSGECMLLGSVSSQQGFGVMDIKAPSACHSSQVSNRPCYSSQTNQCYSSVSQLYFIQKITGKPIFETQGHVDPKMRREEHPSLRKERERESPLAPLFIYFFLPPGPALCKLGLVRSAVLPKVLTPVLGPSFDLPLFYFRGLFPSLSFSHCHFALLLPVLTT